MSKLKTDSEGSTTPKRKTVYVIIIFTQAKDTEPSFKFNSKKTEQIDSSKQTVNGGFRQTIILKHEYTPKNAKENVDFSFNNNGEIFNISFINSESTFIFDPTLKIKKNKIANWKNISQKNVIKIIEKIEIFEKCLEKRNEKEKLSLLYNDSVDFFSSSKDFELLTFLFIKTCEAKEGFIDISKKLLEIFWNIQPNDFDNQNENCKSYKDKILGIAGNSDKLISEKGFDKTKFYGFLMFYLNIYDINKFTELAKKIKDSNESETFFMEILVHYSNTFSNDINISLEKYIKYLVSKGFKALELSGFGYFKKIGEFIHIINKIKEELITMNGFKTLKIPKDLNYSLENPETFFKELTSIIDYSKNSKKIIIIFLSGIFWKEMTNNLEKQSADNIYYLFSLRNIFQNYFQFVKENYKQEHAFYINAEETEEKDEIAVILNRIIQKNIEDSKDITNDEIITQITKYDIYYKEIRYKNRRELNFLDKINFEEQENDWKSNFKNSKFEEIFADNLEEYILKLETKIKKMEDLGIVIDIININKIQEMNKMEYLIGRLRKKVFVLMKAPQSLKEKDSKNNKLSALIKLFKTLYEFSKKLDKIQDILDKLDNENKHIIFLELLKSFPNDKPLKEYIFCFYINNINAYYKNINELLGILDEENIKLFMSKISDETDDKKKDFGIISYEDFFTDKESLKLNLLQELKKEINLIKKTQYYGKSKKILEKIYNSIENKNLEIKYLTSLQRLSKDKALQRFELLAILNKSNTSGQYEKLIENYKKSQEQIKELQKISDSLKLFLKGSREIEIKEIEDGIDRYNNGSIKEFENINKLILELGDDIKLKVEKINQLKDSTIFRNLFNKTQGNTQDERFDAAYNNLESEFEKIKRNTRNIDEKMKEEFQIIIKALGKAEDKQTQEDMKYIEDSSNAEEDINSMIFFCENFKLDYIENEVKNKDNNGEIKEELENILRIASQNVKNNQTKKESLNKLKELGIYDCEKKGENIEFFNLFNNQKEAIDFLLTKTHDNLEIIKDKLISNDVIITNDIDEVDNCIDFFNNELKKCKNQFELFEKIKNINNNLLANFIKFINKFQYLVELDNNSDNSYNIYMEAKKYFTEATYNTSLIYEEYSYIDTKSNKETKMDLEKIKSIKHKINIPNEVEIKLKEKNDLPEGRERISMEKTLLLLKYKEVVSNIELIEQFISVFQTKGCSLPIEIVINIKYPEVTYYLKKQKKTFGELSKYLLNVKNYLEKTLDWNYKSRQNLRFLYGKQFDTLSQHIVNNKEIPSFLRYILNNLDDNITIKQGIKMFKTTTVNYVDYYKDYNNDWFQIYNNYISSMIKENGTSIEDLYDKMKIKSDTDDGLIYKGIYLYKSDYNSMEEDILKIFIEKTKNIPIAQNILISNKETSFEEIQAFFHRAFLCRFNSLFAIEINDSLSDIQLKIMNHFISQLLKFQLDEYNKNNNEKVDIKETSKYIEPLIIFVYNANKLNESFLNEINKFNPGEYPTIKGNISLVDKDAQSTASRKKTIPKLQKQITKSQINKKVEEKLNQILHNKTHIYSSEICGLGKTEKIKYDIINIKKKDYIYFPLGGKLSRNIIFKKVERILQKIKDIMKTAIHLDLYETEDTSILNEFLFSFCFTKFYVNDKDVLYIPINMEIYIEIPNCFYNFLENYPILNYFDIINIKFEDKEKLRLNQEQLKFFKWMIPKKKDQKLVQIEPEEYINSHFLAMGINKYSYHQVNIFIKLFINQYKMDDVKLEFFDKNKNDVTEQCIEEFAKCTKYFIWGIYAKYLTKSLDEEKKDIEKENTETIGDNDVIIKNNYTDKKKIYASNVKFELSSISFDDDNNNINKEEEIRQSIKIDNKIEDKKKKIIKDINNNKVKGYEELRKDYIDKLSNLYENDLIGEKYKIPLIFNFKNKDYMKRLFLSDKALKSMSEDNFLEKIKEYTELENPVSKDENSKLISLKEIIQKDNYVITIDNFRKMMLVLYRILADIPVILMGETGCGKTGLIRKLYQLLNNGEDMDEKKNMVNVDSSINDVKLIEKMNYINKEARAKKDKDFWVLFDEINTCNSLGLLNEIFINRSYNGINIEKNIRLIGTCNPYRLKSEKEDSCGLSHPYKNKNLAYDVNILPQSLMYFVFNFGYLQQNDEDRYIMSILTNHFKNFPPELINIVKKIISESHKYLRKLYGLSVVSLREIKRFLKLYDNLIIYYKNKDELESISKDKDKNIEKNKENNIEKNKENNIEKNKENNIENNKENNIENNKENKKEDNNDNECEKNKVNQIKALIVTTYLCYYIRLIDPENRSRYETSDNIKPNLQELANYYAQNDLEIKTIKEENINDSTNNENQNEEDKNYKNHLGLKWAPLIKEYRNFKSDNIKTFSIFFENECDYVIDNIILEKGIAKNRILKENIFLLFISITSNIPLIIIGKPGSSKSLSFQLLKKSMRGKYSKSNFFRKYPQILTTYFQGSESTLADDIDNLFEKGKEKLNKTQNNKENKQISLIIFDEIGLSEFAKDNPVKVLHKNLEYDGVKDGLSFVGLSNWKLDSSKLNRVLCLSVPDLDSQIDDLRNTAKCIAESIRENNFDNELLDILSKSYKSYQEKVIKIKEYVVYKELEIQEMKEVLEKLTNDEIKDVFKNKEKKNITLDDFKKERKEIIKKINIDKKYSWELGDFASVKEMDEFKILYAKNRSVNQEFHGNRDFYNYNKGVYNIKSLSKNMESNDSNIGELIEKVIERNFGGVEINIDIDSNLKFGDEKQNLDNFKKMVTIITKENEKEEEKKIPSIFLFKYIYNKELNALFEKGNNDNDESDEIDRIKLEKYRINDNNLIKYDLAECIKGNINDNEARFLLLEIDEGLKYLIYRYIDSQNKDKIITYLEGSPFINDIKDKSGEYKIKKISEIQNYCSKEMILILSNLNQIYPFLYDFFNRNFIIKDDKKYGRICQGNFTEQLTYINDKFRIIIMIDKNFINKQEAPFLTRFEKEIVNFEDLLNNKQKTGAKNIFDEIRIKEQFKINYNIENLMINFDQSSVERLYFYYSNLKTKVNQEEKDIKQIIIEKISRTLPQDIIINLDDNHPIKMEYKKRKIFNFKDYINYLNNPIINNKKEKINIFKFSVIYTFTSIITPIEGFIDNNSQQIISEIKRENNLIELINEKKFKNKKADNNFFIMHIYQHELNKINFIITTLKNNYKDEKIIFIFIVHIKRIMDKKRKEKIYSFPDIDEEVDQIFIDNLNGLPISLESIENEGIRKVLEDKALVNKNNEFFKALKAYYNGYTDILCFIKNYLTKIINYFNDNDEFIEIILSEALSLLYKDIKDNKDENKEIFKEIKNEIFDNSYITHNSVDIVSSIINDVIIGKRLRNAIMMVIDTLESNNFLINLLTLDNKTSNKYFSKENLLQMMKKYLKSVKITDIQRKATFKTNYLIPGFYSFYHNISEFISKNISQRFFKNEKKLRDSLKRDIKLIYNFHLEEENLLKKLSAEIIADESDIYKFINEEINNCPSDILLNDYINYFLEKNNNEFKIIPPEDYKEIKSDTSDFENDEEEEKEDEKINENNSFYVEIINRIISLKYKVNSKIITENKGKDYNKFLIKIIWLEANKNYILTVVQLFEKAKNKIYKNKSNILLEQLNNIIENNKLVYITDETRNPEHTKEVNECYYIIIGALYLSITDLKRIVLYDPNNNKDYVEAEKGQIKVKIGILILKYS